MKKNWIAGGVALVLVLVMGAWLMGWFEREDALVAEVREIAEKPQSRENDDAMRNLMRDQMKGLNEEQRVQMFEQMAPIFIPIMAARFEQQYDKFMAMSEADRNKELDKRIAEMQKRGGPGAGGGRPGGGGPGGGGRPNVDPKKMDEFRKKMLDWVTPAQRGKFQNGMQLFNARLKEKGLPPVGPPGGGGGFF